MSFLEREVLDLIVELADLIQEMERILAEIRRIRPDLSKEDIAGLVETVLEAREAANLSPGGNNLTMMIRWPTIATD